MIRLRCENLDEYREGDKIVLDRAESTHLFKIMRASKGDRIGLLNGQGLTGTAVVEDDRSVRLENVLSVNAPARRIHLYLAPPRRQKMDQILRETTELGVYRIVPMICDFSVAIPDAGSTERQTDLLFEACKQSGNAFLPKLASPVKFAAALTDAAQKCALNVVGSPYENDGGLGALPDDVGFFVGPEGGFSLAEEQAMQCAGFRPMRIGPWILRVETAAVAGIARLWG